MVLFRMGMQASFLIAAILAIRKIFSHRFPPEFYLVLWDAVLARMLIPGFVHSPFSVYSFLPVRLREDFTRNVPGRLLNPLFVIWLGGVLISGSFFVAQFIILQRQSKDAAPFIPDAAVSQRMRIHRPVQIFVSDKICSPYTIGILLPKIFLPRDAVCNGLESEWIIIHEYMHIRRWDSLRKFLAVLAFCLHWYQPFSWGMLYYLTRDIEIGCDKSVVRYLGNDRNHKRMYASVLMRFSSGKFSASGMTLSFAQSEIEERILFIMSSKNGSFVRRIVCSVFAFGIVIFFATSSNGALVQNIGSHSASERLPDPPLYTEQRIHDQIVGLNLRSDEYRNSVLKKLTILKKTGDTQ